MLTNCKCPASLLVCFLRSRHIRFTSFKFAGPVFSYSGHRHFGHFYAQKPGGKNVPEIDQSAWASWTDLPADWPKEWGDAWWNCHPIALSLCKLMLKTEQPSKIQVDDVIDLEPMDARIMKRWGFRITDLVSMM